MNFLIIIPDLASGSGMCSVAISKELQKKGDNVYILTRYATNKNNIKTYGYYDKIKKNRPLVQSIKRVLLYPVWPFFSYSEFRLILSKADRIIEKRDINVIISVYNPIESILAGYILKKRYPKLGYIPYFLDALLAGPVPKFMPKWFKKLNSIIFETLLLSNADVIVMMKAAESIYRKERKKIKYYDKIRFLDLPLYIPCNITNRNQKRYFPISQKVFLFAGALPNNIRNPKYLLDLFMKCNQRNYHLYIAGDGYYTELVKSYCDRTDNIHYLGVLDNDLIKDMYKEADYLINIGNTLNNMVPSKIFEYMSQGKPIISTLKIDKDPSLDYLRQYKDVCIIDENINYETNIKILINFDTHPHNRTEDAELFKLNKPSTFVECIYKTLAINEL